ncbi:uncharacterized protein METZ01_LOCUS138038, partial [marine metagenome]
MSGVRAENKELTQIGLTLPGIIERNKIVASLPSLSLLTLAALTPRKYEVDYKEIADLNKEADFPNDYDLVAITSYSAQIYDAYNVANRYIKKNIPVVMGGLHVSSLPEEAKKHCTSIVIGEGEPLWPELLEDFEKGSLKPMYASPIPGGYDLK